MLYGYGGNILYVDLTTGASHKKKLTQRMAEKYLGGEGLAMKLASEEIPAGVDPLAPESPIVAAPPALAGTSSPQSGKTSWVMKFPLAADETGKSFVGSAKGGSTAFPLGMKAAGYDAIVIKGRADKFCYLKISDDEVTLEDAEPYRGWDPEKFTSAMRSKHGIRIGVTAIGRAGEQGIKWSLAYQDAQGTVGRHGAGAMFASKNLKAICVEGTKSIQIAHPKKFRKKAKEVFKKLATHPATPAMQKTGYHAFWHVWQITLSQGNTKTHEYGKKFEHGEDYTDRVLADACCPMSCKCSLSVPDGAHKGKRTLMHSVQIPMLADRLEIDDVNEAINLAVDYNAAGLDGLTFMSMADWLTRLYAEGKISKEEFGFELKRDVPTYKRLLDMILDREGVGDILAEGLIAASQHFGIDVREDTVIRGMIKGCDPTYDARMTTLDPLRFLYLVCPRPNHAGYHDITTIPSNVPQMPVTLDMVKDNYSKGLVLPEELVRAFTPVPYYGAGFNAALLTIVNERNGTLYNSLGFCSIPPVLSICFAEDVNELWRYASGIEKDVADLVASTDGIYNLYRELNAREGFSRKDDWVEAWFTPRETPGGPLPLMDYYRTRVLTKDDVNHLLDDYYAARDWDVESGNPMAA